MYIRKFIFLVCAIVAASCTVDYIYFTDVEFQNNSSVTISFVKGDNSIVESVAAGESVTIHLTDARCPAYALLCAQGVESIVFDNATSLNIASSKWAEDSTYKVIKSDKTSIYHCYTFTDADYQYALEHGTKLEVGE